MFNREKIWLPIAEPGAIRGVARARKICKIAGIAFPPMAIPVDDFIGEYQMLPERIRQIREAYLPPADRDFVIGVFEGLRETFPAVVAIMRAGACLHTRKAMLKYYRKNCRGAAAAQEKAAMPATEAST
jgi:hypothetical protein